MAYKQAPPPPPMQKSYAEKGIEADGRKSKEFTNCASFHSNDEDIISQYHVPTDVVSMREVKQSPKKA